MEIFAFRPGSPIKKICYTFSLSPQSKHYNIFLFVHKFTINGTLFPDTLFRGASLTPREWELLENKSDFHARYCRGRYLIFPRLEIKRKHILPGVVERIRKECGVKKVCVNY
ncbi:MAG: hypothetical protein C6I01_01795 [Epsilonproteobacteria bacterium]|nr:hypothetical protein [Campylobacterota bacterium]